MSRALDDLDPRFRPKAIELLARLVEAQIMIMIIDTLRTPAEHARNLARGVSWVQRSKHCLRPDHRVLSSDLVWKPGGDVLVGESLLAFDEGVVGGHGNRRSYRHTTVLAAIPDRAEVYRVIADDDTEFHATADHRWLVDSGFGFHWVTTTQLRRGPRLNSALVKAVDTFQPLSSFDAGWLAGFIDGEGSLATDGAVSFAQRPGPILDRAIAIAKNLGYELSIKTFAPSGLGKGDCVTVRIQGGWNARLAFLGSVRPRRLLSNFLKVEHRLQGTQRRKVRAIEKVGRRDIIKLQTNTGTFIADGFAMHNCDGLAIDICPFKIYNVFGQNKLQWDGSDPIWERIGLIGEASGLLWGGRWRQRDLGHFEIRDPAIPPTPSRTTHI